MNIKTVAAVCENTVKIYGELSKQGIRPFIKSIEFPTYGAALSYAIDYDEKVKEQNK